MKKTNIITILAFMLIMIAQGVSGELVLKQNYNNTGLASIGVVGRTGGGDLQENSQSFTANSTYDLKQATIWFNSKTATDWMNVSLESDNSGAPSGTPLCSGMYKKYNPADVNVGGEFNVTFNNTCQVSNGVKYWLVFYSNEPPGTTKGFYQAGNLTNVWGGGNFEYRINGGAWSSGDTRDIYLKIYAEENTTNVTITAINTWNSSALTNFSVIINGTDYNQTLTNVTGGTITTGILSNSTYLYNITYTKNDYFNRTYLNVNVSSNHQGILYQGVINFSVKTEISNISQSNFTITLNGTVACNTTTTVCPLSFPNAGNYTVIVTSLFDNFNTLNTSLIINVFDNGSVQFNVTQFLLNVTAINLITDATINNFSLVLKHLIHPEHVFNSSTTNGYIVYGVEDGVYNLTIDAPGYANTNSTVTLNITGDLNYTFYLYTTNSVNITYRNVLDYSIMSGVNVSVQLIGETNINETTDTGWVYVDLLTPSDYSLISDADGYVQNHYYFTVVNRTFTNLTVYLTPDNTTSLVLITVRDKYSKDPVKNSLVTVQRFTTSWVTDQILLTDFNGQTEGYFVVSTVFYNFLVEVGGINYFGVVNSNEDKKAIYAEDVSQGIFIEIDTNPNTVVSDYQRLYDVITSCSFTNTSNTSGYFLYSYDDTDNLPHSASLQVFLGGVLNCSNSVSSSESAIINCSVSVSASEGLKTFFARGVLDGEPVEQCDGTIGVDNVRRFNWGVAGFVLTLFMTILGYLLFARIPSISIPVGTGVFVLCMLFNLAFGGTEFAVFLSLLFFAFLISRFESRKGADA